jgi:hypothetical protein
MLLFYVLSFFKKGVNIHFLTYPLKSGKKNKQFIMYVIFFLFDHFSEARAKKHKKIRWLFGVWGDTKISF